MEPTEVDTITATQVQLFENMELLQQEWQECVLHAKQAGKIQAADEAKVSDRIQSCLKEMIYFNETINKPLLRAIRDNLVKAKLSVQGGLSVAGDSSTPRP